MSAEPGRFVTPLRYPGGKGKVANYLKLLLLENDLIGRDYAEPYAGGASVALSLLFEDFVDTVHINDLNPGVYAFWCAAAFDASTLCERIESTPVTVDEWHRQREVHMSLDPDPMDLAFATFFLNRTNRSGIINGGVIGGLHQTGPWKIDARYNKSELIHRIRKVGRHRSRIEVTQTDGAEFLKPWTTGGQPSTFLYLDPPYFVKGAGLYDNFYGPGDHAQIAGMVRDLEHPWVASYDSAPEILALYQDSHSITYDLSYSAHKDSRGGSEVMFFSDELTPPDLSPAGVRAPAVADARTQAAIF